MQDFLKTIPAHLQEYITEQHPELYTAIDQALWRFVMRISRQFFNLHAHPTYAQGVEATGMSLNHIPLISEMDEALKKIGWRAVAINGFIPPSVFLEFQALKILAIACDIRKLENLGYTPSPDIIHEAAGHAPIIADPAYRHYLESYGEVARHAMISKDDLGLYEAIFQLSEIKENPSSTLQKIDQAQKHLDQVVARLGEPSEAALLTRMAWWTNEYGLVGDVHNPRIYGAGLLSSVSESYHCLGDQVKKIPFSLKAVIETSYDITRPQPQLFVAKDFKEIEEALEEFANTMAYRRGGRYGLEVAQKAQNTATVVVRCAAGHEANEGQYTGIVQQACNEGFVLSGKKQFSNQNKSISEISHREIADSFFVPLFSEEITQWPIEKLRDALESPQGLVAQSGIKIFGKLLREVQGFYLVKDYRVEIPEALKIILPKVENKKLVPLKIGYKVSSVFGGAADRTEFVLRDQQKELKVKIHKTNRTAQNQDLEKLYQQVREFRLSQNSQTQEKPFKELLSIYQTLKKKYPKDWLLRLELYELFKIFKLNEVMQEALNELEELKKTNQETQELITRGLELHISEKII